MGVLAQKQLIKHNPSKGKFGDCYRTAIACILGIEAYEVPHVFNKGAVEGDEDGFLTMRNWLLTRGFGVSKAVFNGDLSFEDFSRWMDRFNRDVPILVTGKSAREVNHCVVMVGGSVFCDPADGTDNSSPFVGPAEAEGESNWWVEVLVPLVDCY